MSETEQATLADVETVDIEVASDPRDAKTVVTGMTVTAEEQANLGDYESYTPYQSVRVQFSPAIDIETEAGRSEVRRRAVQLHHDLQKDLERAIAQRLADPEFEDWPAAIDRDTPKDS